MKTLRIVIALVPAIKRALEGATAAMAEDSPGGRKITREESKAIAVAVLGDLVDPLSDELIRVHG